MKRKTASPISKALSAVPPDRPIRLRGHHLLCILTYIGRGYSADFVANFDALAVALSRESKIEIVNGPDDICRPVMNGPDSHCFDPDTQHRDSAALLDVGNLLGQALCGGDHVTLAGVDIDRLRTAYAAGSIRSACSGCRWYDICTNVAGGGFDGVRLRPCADTIGSPDTL